jgi:hypothetical protein
MAITNDNNKQPDFNGVNQQQGMQEEFQKERETNPDELSKIDDMSLDDSIRNYAEVSGSTFGMESSTAKFSNIGQKNQARKGEGDADIEDVNQANHERGNGGSMYSDYLNNAQNEFISGTGQFEEGQRQRDEHSDSSIRPFDAMQGNRENGSGGQSEDYEAYDPSGNKRPNE